MKLHYFNVPVSADSVATPIVSYGEGATTINFVCSDERWGRLTFEKLDSIRVSRGEYDPYPRADSDVIPYSWVSTVSDSDWLQERYSYENGHCDFSWRHLGRVDRLLYRFLLWL